MSKYPIARASFIKDWPRYDTGEIKIHFTKRWKHFNYPTRHFRIKIWIAKIIARDAILFDSHI